MAPKRPASLKVRALQWLAQREHSRMELRGKLLRLLPKQNDELFNDSPASDTDDASSPAHTAAESAAEIDALLDWLVAHGYVSQQRFVESRVHARQSRFGNLRIQRELQMHGVALDASERQGLKESEYERARAVWRKKFANTNSRGASAADTADDASADGAANAAARLRQMRFLSGRGFSPEVIRRVLSVRDDDEHDGEQ